jgi:hypothetical protein
MSDKRRTRIFPLEYGVKGGAMGKNKKTNTRDEIVHGTFVMEGTMVAFPLCFPGASAPIVADESHITALDTTPEGMVYGGTSGKKTHLFVGMFHGVTGAVFDMGLVEGADHCSAICCGNGQFVACVNGADGGRFIRRKFQNLPFDLLQEWGFRRIPFDDLGFAVKGEQIIHAVTDPSREKIIASTKEHLVSLDIGKGEVKVIADIAGFGRLAIGQGGEIFGMDTSDTLWCYDIEDGKIKRKVIQLPEGSWQKYPPIWAKDTVDGKLYITDDEGHLFSLTEKGFSSCLGQTPLTPVGPMAVTFDGRLFGVCGEKISNLFCYNPSTREINTLGVAVSVIQRRRYGYTFGDAVTGRDGQIILGEDDDLGHLWLYFPRILRNNHG